MRKRVPDDLKPVLGQTEIKRSLRTNRKSDATATKHQIAMALDHLFAHARQVAAGGGTFPKGWAQTALDRLLTTPREQWAGCLGSTADQMPPQSPATNHDRWMNPIGMDNVFVPVQQFQNSPHGLLMRIANAVEGRDLGATPTPKVNATGTTIRTLYEHYLNERKIRPKTDDSWRVAFRRFFEVTGLDWESDIGVITKAHAREFKQAMLRLPRTTLSAKYKGKTTPQIIEMADCEDKASRDRHGADATLVARVASKTAERDVSAVAAVLNYGENDGYFGDGVFSPFRGITVDTSGSGRWHPFTQPQLKAIFSDPIFRETTWDADQWMIVLGYATGAREEELGALLMSDVIDGGNENEGSNWYLSITNIDRSLKTETSRRCMPIHTAVLDLGFLNFYEKRRARGEVHLFDLEEYRGSRTQRWSKWFNQTFLVRNKAKTKVHVFHSWRHTFADLLRAAMIEDRVQDALTGHKPVGMNARYGSGQPLAVLRDAIDRIKLPYLMTLLRPR